MKRVTFNVLGPFADRFTLTTVAESVEEAKTILEKEIEPYWTDNMEYAKELGKKSYWQVTGIDLLDYPTWKTKASSQKY